MQLEQRRLRRVAADDVARGLVLLERTLQGEGGRWRCGGGGVEVEVEVEGWRGGGGEVEVEGEVRE